MAKPESMEEQYRDGKNLGKRISLHQRFSTNPYGFSHWLMDQYQFPQGGILLELGCGTGDMWKGSEERARPLSSLILTDLSAGMVEEARKNLNFGDKARFLTANITELPFQDQSFHVVIANMMLYHVADKDRALREVKRVLRKDGRFYCATFGDYNLVDYLHHKLAGICRIRLPDKSFTLQNGAELLRRYFGQVECRRYKDSFAVSDITALAAYVESLPGIDLTDVERERLYRVLEKEKDGDGLLRIPKDYGSFVAWRG